MRGIDDAPDLAGVSRLEPGWLAAFLMEPHDVRPGLRLQMPRLAIDEDAARDIVAFLRAASSRPAFDDAAVVPNTQDTIAAGRALFASRGCQACHAYTGAWDGAPTEAIAANALAPDLAFTRQRMEANVLVSWLQGPSRWHSATRMPDHGLGAQDATLLAAFVLNDPLPAREAPTPVRLPLLQREVRFDEVAERVLRRVCWHCHAAADLARGDGGPGNTGGFGFPPRRVDLATYEGVSSGRVDDDGERHSLFESGPLGPRLLEVLLARQAEVRGEPVPGVRGMPLGLPPLSDEDIALVESWIAQGRLR